MANSKELLMRFFPIAKTTRCSIEYTDSVNPDRDFITLSISEQNKDGSPTCATIKLLTNGRYTIE